MRGMLKEDIQQLAKEYLGREITQEELRLYPYMDYVLKNGGRLDFAKLSPKEIEILESLADAGYIRIIGSYLYIYKKFYEYINKVLWIAYVETKLED